MGNEPPIEVLKAIAHPVRNSILRSLSGAERNVGEIEEASGVGQPTLSQQLAVLRKNGLVSTRRHGKLIYYAAVDETLAHAAEHIASLIAKKPSAHSKSVPRISGVANFAKIS